MNTKSLFLLASVLALGACDYSNTSASDVVGSIGLSVKRNDLDGFKTVVEGDAAAQYGNPAAFDKLKADFSGLESIWAEQITVANHEAGTTGDVTRNYSLVIRAKDNNGNIRDLANATVFCHVTQHYYDNSPSYPTDPTYPTDPNDGWNRDHGGDWGGGGNDSDRHRDEPGEGPSGGHGGDDSDRHRDEPGQGGGGHRLIGASLLDSGYYDTETCALTSVTFK